MICPDLGFPSVCSIRDRYARSESEPSEGPPLGRLAQRLDCQYEQRRQHRPAAHLFCEDQGAPRGSNLLALQTESFDWLLGNAAWKGRVEAALESGQEVPTKSGLEEIFEEISPIEDFSGSMSLTFRDHRFEPRRTPSTSARSATSRTRLRSSSPPSSPTTRPARSSPRRSSWATSRS